MKFGRLFLLAALSFSLMACEGRSLSNREKGTIGRAALGTGLGAIIGHATGSTGAGMAIGAGAGALAGGLIGNEQDNTKDAQAQQDERIRRQDEELRRQRREIDQMKQQQGY